MDRKEKGIKDVLDAMYKKYRMTQKMDEIRLVNAWEKIVGPLISKHTTSVKMLNKTLYVSFDSAPLKNEMMYRRQNLIDAINTELGAGVVEKVFVK